MNNKFTVLSYKQFNQEYISLALPLRIITAYSHVMVYGESDYGYQRKPEPQHYRKIVKYMLDPEKAKILPTSIILGADKETIKKHVVTKDGTKEIDFDNIDKSNIFRIVDGQHRIEGVRVAAEKDPCLNDYIFNVIILLISNENRSSEVNVFTDINSKAKRIRTDLAELANHNYEILEKRITKVSKHIAIKVAYELKEDSNSVWYKAIKFDIHSDVVLGVVGVNTFSDSIEAIVDKYIGISGYNIGCEPHELIVFTETASKEISAIIKSAWEIVAKKWQKCFSTEFNYDEEQQLHETRYNKSCYIQKTLGAKAINGILGEVVKLNGFSDAALERFENIIDSSSLKSDDWMAGQLFSGLSSESGVTKVKNLIQNK
ncbi:DGQHR domain-containing protein [Geobacter pelophilus]|uniref:DGQHR domain-containing protein n=1 Tax=Geoanaerobacter pelophilus TaxID=60036 RepID=A0AAW4L0M3_9BACT|nr:DGQHR domain-containing protein [Geoanaerobacter pelophilus]MBT0664501.1 DGQHR domain-containing protein [Geoanaerobacter pelophilus]